MSSQFPQSVPVCSDTDERSEERSQAKENQRPFLAVVDDDDLPGWQAVYMMDTTGEGRRDWYYLDDEAVDTVEGLRSDYESEMTKNSWVSSCSDEKGELHGLDKQDAIDLAEKFSELAWDKSNWKQVSPRDLFYEEY